MILQNTINYINKKNLINKNDSIVVGFSGGPDSVFLLYLLNSIKEEYNLDIVAVHLNHLIRGKAAKEDEKFSKDFSEKLGVNFALYEKDIPKYAKDNGISTEDAGRRIRYEIFNKELSKMHGNGKIAVGHHKDDLAETILMNFMRGSGSNGLIGIEEKTGNIIRPLLNIEKKEILKFLCENKIPFVEDKTNFENDYKRNQIRNELIPYIKKKYNPNIVDGLVNMSNILKEEQDFMKEYINNLDLITINSKEIVVDVNKLLKEHKAIQRQIIIKAYEALNGSRKDLSYNNIESVINLMYKDSAKFEIKEFNIYIYNKKLYFTKKEKKEDTKILEFSIGNSIKFNEYTIKSEVVKNEKNLPKGPNIAYFNIDILKENLIIRTRKPGDKIKLEGFSKKIKDILIDDKINKNHRDNIPILVCNEDILWIMGTRRSNLFKIKNNMKEIIKISLERTNYV